MTATRAAVPSTNPLPQAPPAPVTLFLAFALGATTWKLGVTIGMAQHPRARTIPAGAIAQLLQDIRRAKERFGLPLDTPVVSCYEAGREGFWLHRCLHSHGITHLVVDSARIAMNRRQRRAQTDRLDLHQLLAMLLRHQSGAHQVWRVVQVPRAAEAERRHLHRELLTAKRDRTRIVNRLQGLLAGYGIRLALQGDVEAQLDHVRQWDGSPLLPALCHRLKRAWQQVPFLTTHIRTLEAERRAALRRQADAAVAKVQQLCTLRGVGIQSAWLSVMEFFAWRELQTPKHIGALAGLTPTPDQSGEARREQGMTQAGHRHRRTMAIEMAWTWRRFQPTSALTHW